MGSRKYAALNVVQMYSTLTLDHWKSCLLKATKARNVEKLISWRYGMQAGLTDAAAKGLTNTSIDLWVMKRCKDLEKCMRYILKQQYKNTMPDPKKDPAGYVAKAKEAKRLRDRAFEQFLMKSNF